MPKAEITSYTVVDLLSWQESGGLKISPKFQRRSVWTNPAKGFFIDSILQDYPVPPIHIRLTHDGGRKAIREVIDGQQRIRAIFDFIAGDFRIPPSVSPGWGGKSYNALNDDDRDAVNLFSFTVYQYKQLSDSDVLDMFSRLNTFSVGLSAQELRNGRWFGRFKQTSYRLATGTVEFWRRHKIFNEQQIARMREAELTSELLTVQLDGMQDKKKSLDTFYEHLDEAWGSGAVEWMTGRDATERVQPAQYLSSKDSETRFQATIKAIDDALGRPGRVDGQHWDRRRRRCDGIVLRSAAEERARHPPMGNPRPTPHRDHHLDRTHLPPPETSTRPRQIDPNRLRNNHDPSRPPGGLTNCHQIMQQSPSMLTIVQ